MKAMIGAFESALIIARFHAKQWIFITMEYEMSDSLKCKADEVQACCCVEIGTIIDGKDCTVDVDYHYDNKGLAQKALDYFTEKARAVESEPCRIKSEIIESAHGAQLKAQFTFSCQAEAMIFQLSTR